MVSDGSGSQREAEKKFLQFLNAPSGKEIMNLDSQDRSRVLMSVAYLVESLNTCTFTMAVVEFYSSKRKEQV